MQDGAGFHSLLRAVGRTNISYPLAWKPLGVFISSSNLTKALNLGIGDGIRSRTYAETSIDPSFAYSVLGPPNIF
ncbi:hypothetical protein YC2023_073783 [Brassica napus]